MKLNSHVIFLIAIVGIITAGVVGATILNNGSMKQVDFDGIKVSVPADSNFVKTADGYADSKYGIAINTFKNKDSMVNYLKSISGASVIPLKNQPPQSVAFVQGDDTKVFVANGGEAIAIGAKDQGLVSDMANTVVFSNHQKSAKPNPIIPVILPPPYLDIDNDFNFIKNLTVEVNNEVFNNETVTQAIYKVADDRNGAIKNNTFDQFAANEFAQNTASDNAADNQQNTSLLDNNDVSNMVSSISSDNPSNGNGAGGDSGAVASSSGSSSGGNSPAASIAPDANANSNPSSSSSSSSGSSTPSSGNSAPADNNQQQKINQKDLKEAIERGLPSGYSISKIEDSGSSYLVFIKDSHGKINKYTYSYDGNKMS